MRADCVGGSQKVHERQLEAAAVGFGRPYIGQAGMVSNEQGFDPTAAVMDATCPFHDGLHGKVKVKSARLSHNLGLGPL
jgi:hypothetical protein